VTLRSVIALTLKPVPAALALASSTVVVPLSDAVFVPDKAKVTSGSFAISEVIAAPAKDAVLESDTAVAGDIAANGVSKAVALTAAKV
jgi:hypothetical protein